MPSTPAPPVDVELLLGPSLVGGLIMSLFLGALWTECMSWVRNYPNERLWLKVLVWSLMGIASTAWVAACLEVWGQAIGMRHNDQELVTSLPLSGIVEFIANNSIFPFCSSFFAYRAWTGWGKNRVFGLALLGCLLAIAVMCITSEVLGCLTFWGNLPPPKLLKISAHTHRLAEAYLASIALFDSSVSVALVVRLQRDLRGDFQRTDSVVLRIIRLSLTTSAITSLMQMANMVTLFTDASMVKNNPNTHTNIALAFSWPLAAIAPLCVLVSLNQRRKLLRGGGGPPGSDRGPAWIGAIAKRRQSDVPESRGSQPSGVEVTVQQLDHVELNTERRTQDDDGSTKLRFKGQLLPDGTVV